MKNAKFIEATIKFKSSKVLEAIKEAKEYMRVNGDYHKMENGDYQGNYYFTLICAHKAGKVTIKTFRWEAYFPINKDGSISEEFIVDELPLSRTISSKSYLWACATGKKHKQGWLWK